ncbi:MAG: hypothetical protein ABEJ81_04135 [Haloferacaceae archaeon]
MSRSSARRGQVEPTVALAAVFAVVVGIALYAGVLAGAMPGARDRNLAAPAAERIHDELAPTADIVVPDRIDRAAVAAPDGYRVNVTVRVATRRWTTGPTAPPTADVATRRTSVRLGPGRVRPGTLRVEVWP